MISHPSQRLSLLYQAVEITTSSIDFKERQELMVETLRREMEAKAVVLFTTSHGTSALAASCASPRALLERLPLQWEPQANLLQFLQLQRQPFTLENDAFPDPAAKLLTSLGHALLLPIWDEHNHNHGIMAVILNETPSGDDIIMLQVMARAIANMAYNFSHYRESRQRITELSLLAEVGQIASSIMDTRQMAKTIIDLLCRFLGAGSGLIIIKNHSDGRYHYANFGDLPERQMRLFAGGQIDPREYFERCVFLCASPEKTALCVALPFSNFLEGYICLFEKISPGHSPSFAGSDNNLLNITASVIAPALGNSISYNRIEELAISNTQMVATLSGLHEISNFLLASARFRHRVIVILQALIHPGGFGYEQAIFFEADHKEGQLRSLARMYRKESMPTQLLSLHLTSLLQQAPEELEARYGLKPELRFPLREDDNPLAAAFGQNKITLMEDAAVKRRLGVSQEEACLILPLASKGQGTGLVLLINSPEIINQNDLDTLKMLADQAEMALEASKTLQNLHTAHRELAGIRNRLLEADRLAAVGEIASGMAHEIRNPLMSIGGLVKLARKQLPADEAASHYLDEVLREVERTEKVLRSIFDVTSDTGANLAPASLSDIMEDAVGLLGDMTAGIQIEREYKPEVPRIYCDKHLIKHVFFNIILNAVQAVNGNGKIILRAGAGMRDGRMMAAGEVEDSGGGIDPAIMGKIFNPFFTTKSYGAGLGLSHAYGIVSRHNGSMEVHNQGMGAAFIVLLPVVL
jgi:signal transduction histidine kinase